MLPALSTPGRHGTLLLARTKLTKTVALIHGVGFPSVGRENGQSTGATQKPFPRPPSLFFPLGRDQKKAHEEKSRVMLFDTLMHLPHTFLFRSREKKKADGRTSPPRAPQHPDFGNQLYKRNMTRGLVSRLVWHGLALDILPRHGASRESCTTQARFIYTMARSIG